MRDASRGRWSVERESSPSERIGEILVSRGKLSEEQFDAALEAKRTDPRRKIGEILLSLDFVSEEDLARAVAEAGALEYVSLTEGLVDPAAIPLLGEKALRKYAALPSRIEDGQLVLAMSDPTNVLALDDLKALSGRPIRPVVALENDIMKLQDRVFGIDEEVSELIETSEDGSRRRRGESGTLSVSRVDKGDPVIRLVNSIIRRALDEGASDIHVEPRAEELVMRYRIDGVLKRGMSAPLRLKDSVISRFKILGNLNISMQRLRHSIGNSTCPTIRRARGSAPASIHLDSTFARYYSLGRVEILGRDRARWLPVYLSTHTTSHGSVVWLYRA